MIEIHGPDEERDPRDLVTVANILSKLASTHDGIPVIQAIGSIALTQDQRNLIQDAFRRHQVEFIHA